jgi:G3E family GTPase
VAWTFSRPGLADFYRVDAIVTVVDAAHLDRALEEAPGPRSDRAVISRAEQARPRRGRRRGPDPSRR